MSQKRIVRELKILNHLNHPNIITLRECILPQTFESFSDVYFVTDLMEADLRDILESNQDLSELHVQYFMYQILLAVSYMHSADVLHRDLKPEVYIDNCRRQAYFVLEYSTQRRLPTKVVRLWFSKRHRF